MLLVVSFWLVDRLTDDAEDIVLAHDQVGIAVDFDFGAAVFRDQHFVAGFDGEIDFLAVVVDFAGAESDDFAFLRFFFRGIRDNDAALFYFLSLQSAARAPDLREVLH